MPSTREPATASPHGCGIAGRSAVASNHNTSALTTTEATTPVRESSNRTDGTPMARMMTRATHSPSPVSTLTTTSTTTSCTTVRAISPASSIPAMVITVGATQKPATSPITKHVMPRAEASRPRCQPATPAIRRATTRMRSSMRQLCGMNLRTRPLAGPELWATLGHGPGRRVDAGRRPEGGRAIRPNTSGG